MSVIVSEVALNRLLELPELGFVLFFKKAVSQILGDSTMKRGCGIFEEFVISVLSVHEPLVLTCFRALFQIIVMARQFLEKQIRKLEETVKYLKFVLKAANIVFILGVIPK